MANQHAYTGPALPYVPEPTHAERTRTLFSLGSTATLCTQSLKHPGFPFGSLMPYALDDHGRPLFLISNMAMHTQNLRADPRASLFLSQSAIDGDPLAAARATLLGDALPLPPDDLEASKALYLAAHPNAKYWVDFTDFSFFRLNPIDLYYVGGFGVMGWLTAPDYLAATPDPLAPHAPGIIAHMNADHTDSMLLLAHKHGPLPGHQTATAALMTSIDRLGFTLRLTTPTGLKATRIAFPAEVTTPAATRTALVEMVRAAKA